MRRLTGVWNVLKVGRRGSWVTGRQQAALVTCPTCANSQVAFLWSPWNVCFCWLLTAVILSFVTHLFPPNKQQACGAAGALQVCAGH